MGEDGGREQRRQTVSESPYPISSMNCHLVRDQHVLAEDDLATRAQLGTWGSVLRGQGPKKA